MLPSKLLASVPERADFWIEKRVASGESDKERESLAKKSKTALIKQVTTPNPAQSSDSTSLITWVFELSLSDSLGNAAETLLGTRKISEKRKAMILILGQ